MEFALWKKKFHLVLGKIIDQWCTVVHNIRFKKNLHLLHFGPHLFLFHPYVKVGVCFIASKHFAAKTGFMSVYEARRSSVSIVTAFQFSQC